MKPVKAASHAGHLRPVRLMLAIAAVALLAACSHTEGTSTNSTAGPYSGSNKYAPGATGSAKGFTLFGGHSTKSAATAGAQGVGVNGYLWRASLDTLSFMPLSSADPFGGTIITDWYSPAQTPDERFKVTVYILDKQLRADGLKVSVFRQTKTTKGSWVDASVDPQTDSKLENAILTRARQLHLNSMNSK